MEQTETRSCPTRAFAVLGLLLLAGAALACARRCRREASAEVESPPRAAAAPVRPVDRVGLGMD